MGPASVAEKVNQELGRLRFKSQLCHSSCWESLAILLHEPQPQFPPLTNEAANSACSRDNTDFTLLLGELNEVIYRFILQKGKLRATSSYQRLI